MARAIITAPLRLKFVRLLTPGFYKKLYHTFKVEKALPATILPSAKDLTIEKGNVLAALSNLGVKTKELPAKNLGGPTNILYDEIAESLPSEHSLVKDLTEKPYIYEIIQIPPPKGKDHWSTNALEHPEIHLAQEVIQKAGYKLIVDTTKKFTHSGAYIDHNTKAIAIGPHTKMLDLFHEIIHLENSGHLAEIALNKRFQSFLIGLHSLDTRHFLETVFGTEHALTFFKYRNLSSEALDERIAITKEQQALGLKRFIPFTKEYEQAIKSELYATQHVIHSLEENLKYADFAEAQIIKMRLLSAQAKIKTLIFMQNEDLALTTLSIAGAGIQVFVFSSDSELASEEEKQENSVTLIKYEDGSYVLIP